MMALALTISPEEATLSSNLGGTISLEGSQTAGFLSPAVLSLDIFFDSSSWKYYWP